MSFQFRRTYKRRRSDATVAGPKRRRYTTAAEPMDIVPGYTRRVGYYGRYGTRASRMKARTGGATELKFFDTALTFNLDTTGEVPATGQLCLIPQGDTESTRDGRKAVIKSIQIRGTLEFQPSTAATAATLGYLAVVLDTQCNGAAAAITDVFTSSAMDRNFMQLNNSGRFRILWRKTYSFHPGAGVSTAYNQTMRQIEMYKRCNIPIDWNSTAGAITEIRSNNIFLIAGAVGSDDTIVCIGNARLRFVG